MQNRVIFVRNRRTSAPKMRANNRNRHSKAALMPKSPAAHQKPLQRAWRTRGARAARTNSAKPRQMFSVCFGVFRCASVCVSVVWACFGAFWCASVFFVVFRRVSGGVPRVSACFGLLLCVLLCLLCLGVVRCFFGVFSVCFGVFWSASVVLAPLFCVASSHLIELCPY